MTVSALGFDVTPANNTTVGSVAAANDMETIKVDDLSRELAAAIKSLVLDIGGATSTAGSVSAYTITSNGFATSLLAGAMMAFRAHTTNTGTATLNVSGLGAKSLVRFTTAGEIPLAGGELVSTGQYIAQYNTALSSGAGAWALLNPTFNGNLAFPATQLASAGANVLDDYEEGTYTPGMTFGGSATGVTFTTQIGVYTKIGNRVLFHQYIVLSSNGSGTGAALTTALPFTSAGNFFACAVQPISGFSGLTAGVSAHVTNSATTITLRGPNTTGSAVLTDTEVTDTANFYVAGHYIV